MNQVERAVSYFEQGYSCSQAILATFGPQLGLEREMALKVAGPFGGGMGGMAETCGVVTGAFMVIGLKHGRTRVEDVQTKEHSFMLVRKFADEFKSRNGTLTCKGLLGHDISTPEGKSLAREKGLYSTLCVGFVRDAAEIIEQILG